MALSVDIVLPSPAKSSIRTDVLKIMNPSTLLGIAFNINDQLCCTELVIEELLLTE